MADIEINISDNLLCDNASVIRNLNQLPKATDSAVDFRRIEKELQEIKTKLQQGSPEFQAVEVLEESSRTHNWSAICSAIGRFTSQFSSAALANLVGAYLSQLLKLGH